MAGAYCTLSDVEAANRQPSRPLVIDNIVNGEYYLPPGDKEGLYAMVREVAEGYTVVGTTYEYNDKNQLISRHNLVRDEVHTYTYDHRGNLTNNGRSKFSWNDENRLVEVLFPDGEGVWYSYDAQKKGQHTTYYDYEGGSWRVMRERNKGGETVASYTYDLNGKPLTITMGETTYWYVYNAHGDAVAITDGAGAVQARYEYDDWGRLEAMYDADGRVREGYGTIGDLGTGPSRPANGKPTPGTEDWSSGGNGQGNGSGKGNGNGKSKQKGGALDLLAPPVQQLAPEPEALLLGDAGEQGEVQIQGVIGEPDDLVKRNPYRYAGYRYDRETQYYYLRTRYYDGRLGRFLSQDTWAGDMRKPLTLNRYIYAVNSPANYVDPSGYFGCRVGEDGGACEDATMDPSVGPVGLNSEEYVTEVIYTQLRAAGLSDATISHYGIEELKLLLSDPPDLQAAEVQELNTAAARILSGEAAADESAINNVYSPGLSVVPGVGDVKDAQESITGVDYITGESL